MIAKEEWIVVKLSAWSASGPSGVLDLFYNELFKTLKNKEIYVPPWLALRIQARHHQQKINETVADAAEITGDMLGGLGDSARKAVETSTRVLGSWFKLEKNELDTFIETLKKRVVVFIDDLDRADPRILPQNLLALRELLDWPKFSFVLAFDTEIVARSLTEYSKAFGDNANLFLEKIVDITIAIPPLSNEQKHVLATQALHACCPKFPQETLKIIQPFMPEEPRRAKLIARNLGLLRETAERHYEGEIAWTQIGLYTVINEASPNLARWLVQELRNPHGGTIAERKGMRWDKDADENYISGEMQLQNIPDSPQAVKATIELYKLWTYTEPIEIQNMLDLLRAEPPFTLKELDDLLGTNGLQFYDNLLNKEVAKASAVSNQTNEYCFEYLLLLAIRHYESLLSAIADSVQLDAQSELICRASTLINFLDCCLQSNLEYANTVGSKPQISTLLTQVLFKYAGWNKNPGEKDLRKREANLILAATKKCGDPSLLYTTVLHNLEKDTPAKKKLAKLITDDLAPMLVAQLSSAFQKQDGLATLFSKTDGRFSSLINRPDSPLYLKRRNLLQITQFLKSAHASGVPNKTATYNARLYLDTVAIESSGLTEIQAEYGPFIQALWNSAVSIPVQFRMCSSLRELRQALERKGVDSTLLKIPVWLAKELKRLDTIQETKTTRSKNAPALRTPN
jgi:KAP family P-loop domain